MEPAPESNRHGKFPLRFLGMSGDVLAAFKEDRKAQIHASNFKCIHSIWGLFKLYKTSLQPRLHAKCSITGLQCVGVVLGEWFVFKERQTVWLAGSGMTTGRTTWRSLLKIQMWRFVQHDGVQGLGDGLLEGVPRGIPPALAASLSGTTQPSGRPWGLQKSLM